MTSTDFTGSGVYQGIPIVKSDSSHIDYLQNNLRDSDVRECMIHGATPFRALMAGLREKNAETYTALVDDKPAAIFGVTPIYEHLIGKIWLLGTYEIENHSRMFLRWSNPIVEYFLDKYYQLENVVPADHKKTILWLDFVGFEIIESPIYVNGFEVFRFVRCKGKEILVSRKEQPVIS